ncbi:MULTISPECIES: glutamate ABC transporter substrate-binding protein [unclassified Corynebacterium]|uniref:glutamate ABC transporter substrate-binding protein n=1 Tax=unclassified Corynebacterium TaxID=2624378 RepID=UPI00143D3354|nr:MULTISPECIES: glutamate ABC transporter substrate-binding protein [unclassified Corynebacterium]
MMKKTMCLGAIGLVFLLTSCASADQFRFEDEHTTPSAYVPLPDGVTLEKADGVAHEPNETTNLLGSLAPDERRPQERVPEIMRRGRLIVGVDQSQYLLGYRDPASGEILGFEADIAREIARDIFGDPSKVEFRFVDSSSWVEVLESNQVDCIIRNISITRQRQDQVFFSTAYLTAQTRLLVPARSEVETIDDLAGKTACVTDKSTSLQSAKAYAPHTNLLVANSDSDCLVSLQQSQADALISDDITLSGIAAQDPFTRITNSTIGEEHYGIAFAKPGVRHNTDGLIRQVNSTLERIFSDGTWYELYDQWLGAYLPTQQPPALNYRSERTVRN